jgi:hypothetical protein
MLKSHKIVFWALIWSSSEPFIEPSLCLKCHKNISKGLEIPFPILIFWQDEKSLSNNSLFQLSMFSHLGKWIQSRGNICTCINSVNLEVAGRGGNKIEDRVLNAHVQITKKI